MAKNNLDADLQYIVGGIGILDQEMADQYSTDLLDQLSYGVQEGDWSELSNPDEFRQIRDSLVRNREWFLNHEAFMDDLRAMREDYPKSHWWLWIEELA